ncbi:MAG: phage terminase small subunit P27 family [Ruminococcus flavefaciens]|nr:phage terminase small subunit P27 family [Ruminococcus flavefaciens]
MTKKVYYQQNNGHLSKDPPHYLGTIASVCWRRIVPFLESTGRVERIDVGLVEQYCVQYEIFRTAYDDYLENGLQSKIFTSVQNSKGEVIGKDFTGFRKNPAVAIIKDSTNQLNSIGLQLGLSPKGRQELMQIASHKPEKSVAEQLKESGLA